jgi:DNA-binding CsgD family transcriptional regulator
MAQGTFGSVTEFLRMIGHTPREAEVGELVLLGKPNQWVADQLHITEKTVKFHLTHIYKKFKVKNRSQYIVKFLAQSRVDKETMFGLSKVHEPRANSDLAGHSCALPSSPSLRVGARDTIPTKT